MIATTISTLLTELLASCVAAYTAAGESAPAVRFVTHGQPDVRGEQLTVAWTSFRPVLPHPLTQQRAPKSNVVPAVDISVEVWRACWPQPNVTQPGAQLPAPAVIQTAALAIAVDAAVLGSWFQRLSVEGGLFPSYPMISTSQDVRVGEMLPTGVQGMTAGLRFPVQVKLAIP